MTQNDDLDWLYRKERPATPEPTSIIGRSGQPGYPSPASHQRPSAYPQPSPAAQLQPTQPPPPARPAAPSQPAPRPRKRRRRRRPVLRIIGLLFLAWTLFLIGTPVYAWTVGNTVDATPAGERPAQQPGTTVLLVGSDAREGLTAEEQAALGTGDTEGRRTDTMLLLHTPQEGQPVLLSLPRDSFVSIPGHGENKLNAAYALGGAPLLVQTIEQNTGIRIDGYLEIGFLGIVNLVDALGGIEVCPTFDIDDADSHLTLSAGCQVVDGVTALGYVRMRKADPLGDIGRVARQREVIAAIAKKAATPMTILNPVTYWNVNQAVASTLTRGTETGIAELAQVGSGMLSTVTGAGLSLTVPVSDTNAQTSAGSSVLWDETASRIVFDAIAVGNTTTLEQFR